jgi:hypothetical protein
MAASLTALGAIVVSDIAQAREAWESAVVLDDDLPLAPPVKMTKVTVKAAEPQLELEALEPDFGSFEGY